MIVNTTPVGTFPNNLQSVISLDDFKSCEAVIDVIYNPFKTKLLLDAEKLDIRHTNGLPMLVAQATAAAGYFLKSPGAFESENEKNNILPGKADPKYCPHRYARMRKVDHRKNPFFHHRQSFLSIWMKRSSGTQGSPYRNFLKRKEKKASAGVNPPPRSAARKKVS